MIFVSGTNSSGNQICLPGALASSVPVLNPQSAVAMTTWVENNSGGQVLFSTVPGASSVNLWEIGGDSGFSVDQSVFLPEGDRPGIERLVRYMTRCPFSLSRLVKVTDTGQVVYKAEKQAWRAFPEPRRWAETRRQAKLPCPRPAGFPGGVYAAHPAEGLASHPLLRLVLE